MRSITEICVHCSATRPEWLAGATGETKVTEIRRWHRERGWRDIGYHYVIDRDGKPLLGRPVELPGAHEPRVNAHSIGVCLIGGHGSSPDDEFGEHYTQEQGEALRALIEGLRTRYPTITRVSGHNEYAAKACPGFRAPQWLDGKPARKFANSRTAVGAGGATGAATALAVVQALPTVLPPTPVNEGSSVAAALPPDPPAAGFGVLQWVLLAVVLAGAGYALWRRWRDWQAGRR